MLPSIWLVVDQVADALVVERLDHFYGPQILWDFVFDATPLVLAELAAEAALYRDLGAVSGCSGAGAVSLLLQEGEHVALDGDARIARGGLGGFVLQPLLSQILNVRLVVSRF